MRMRTSDEVACSTSFAYAYSYGVSCEARHTYEVPLEVGWQQQSQINAAMCATRGVQQNPAYRQRSDKKNSHSRVFLFVDRIICMEHDWNAYIESGIAALPERFRKQIANVAILLEDDVSDVVRREQGLGQGDSLLGLYVGIPFTERGEGYGIGEALPDTITIFKLPTLAEAAETDGDVARVVRETIWHEFGHYFGFDEDEVQEREHRRFGAV